MHPQHEKEAYRASTSAELAIDADEVERPKDFGGIIKKLAAIKGVWWMSL
jgi:hypothetical protein